MLSNSKKIFITPENVICNAEQGWSQAIPYFDGINLVNKLFLAGHEVFFWTNNTDEGIVELIKKKLDLWHVNYTDVGMAKPNYDLWIDPESRLLSDRLVYCITNGLQH